jgi:membrane protease YdiL (CAAX protease family)
VTAALANPHWETGVAQLVYPIFAGVGFAGVVLRTRSIWLAMAAHALLIVANVVVAGVTVDTSAASPAAIRMSAAVSVLVMVPWLFYGLYLIRDARTLSIGSGIGSNRSS